MKSLFSIINDKFFSPLSSQNKDINLYSLLFLYELIDELEYDNVNTKSKIEEALANKLDDRLTATVIEEDNYDLSITNSLDKARYIIKTFINCGWIYEEAKGNYEFSLNFFVHARKIINLLISIMKETKATYSGSLYTIFSLIKDFDFNQIEKLIEINSNTENLLNDLKALRSNIHQYYVNLLQDKDNGELDSLSDNFWSGYKTDFIDSAYKKLRSVDIPRYKSQILEGFNKLKDSESGRSGLSLAYMRNEDTTLDVAKEKVEKIFENISDAFNMIDTIIDQIDYKNQLYITAFVSKIHYFTRRSNNIVGLCNQLIEVLSNNENQNIDVRLFSSDFLDGESLFRPRIEKSVIKPVKLKIEKMTEDEIEVASKYIFSTTKYPFDKVNNYVAEILREKHTINASDLSSEDPIRIIAIVFYSLVDMACYELKVLNNKIIKGDYQFKDFQIYRRGEFDV